jgi:hypothetical protein
VSPEFTRPKDGLRYEFAGMRLSQVPDALPPNKYPAAINIRAVKNTSVTTRPGQVLKFSTADDHGVTDISSYAGLFSDNKPRVVVRDASDGIWLNPTAGTVGVKIGTLAGAGAGKGASMIPFRPNASPIPYMYIANGSDYQKFSAPDALDGVTSAAVGIAEPQTAPDAALQPNLNTSASSSETLRPTNFENPSGVIDPGVGSWDPWSNPSDAIDGNTATYAFCQTWVGPSLTGKAAQCKWFDWPVASFPYTSLNLIIDMEIVNVSGAPTPSDPFIVLNYSPDGGTSWLSFATVQGATARQTYPIILPPSTDLTQLQFDAYTIGRDITPVQIILEFRIYDIKTVGENSVGFFDQTGIAADWTESGTAGAPADVTGPGDTAVAIFSDPLNPSVYSIGFASAGAVYAWQTGQTMFQGSDPFLILDVMQPALNADIAAIYYFAGTAGHCIIVPQNLPAAGVPSFKGNNPSASPFLSPNAIASLRRGAILKLGGSEYVYVLSVTTGPNNTICIETSTVGTFAAGDALTTPPTLIAFGSNAPTLAAMNAPMISSAVTTGTGQLTRTVDFFQDVFSTGGLQDADYLHVSLQIDAPENLTEIHLQFDVGDGSFASDFYYYVIRPSDLSGFLAGLTTQLATAQTVEQRSDIDASDPTMASNRGTTDSGNQLSPGANQRTEFLIPISSLTRVGTNTNTLIDATNVQIQVIAAGNLTLQFGALSTWGGNQPDVGQQGIPYFYRIRPRSKATGVIGNPSPASRYGVNPLRFGVVVSLPSAAYDPQIDTWDIFRYGGSITSWRYIGSTPAGSTLFTDNYNDDAALVGDPLDFDNFQPWPSIDIPNNGTALSVVGTSALVTSTRADILSYLPGTLVQLAGQNVYTLRARPTLVSGTTYLLEFIENAGALTNVSSNIQEPVIAQRRLPYMWGPDASGTMFAVGDSLRPGTLYFAKPYSPDSAPDAFNQEIVGPAEPLLGGEILDGLSFVGSSERWWALYSTPDNPAQRYNPVQQPFVRGLAAPFGHCNDGQSLYWWAKDGIQSSTKGSLTDADLYSLFPHEGVVGKSVTYGPYTFQPPDYARAGTFRLAYCNYYLYALYQDSSGVYHVLVLDTRRMAWSEDIYSPKVCSMFHPAQQAGTLLTNTERYEELFMGTIDGRVASQQDATNDLDAAISAAIATFEYPGEDVRAPKQWGDYYLDLTPNSAVTTTPFSGGVAVAAPTVTPASTREQVPISVGGVIVSQFLGLLSQWTDNFGGGLQPTSLHLWQPSFAVQPARTLAFVTFGTSYGIPGFMHIQQLAIAYVSTQPITITITSYDGQSPVPLIIPSTGGAYQKAIFQLTPNKGQLYRFAWASAAPFQIFLDDCEIHVGNWGRTGPYLVAKNMGGVVDAAAPI